MINDSRVDAARAANHVQALRDARLGWDRIGQLTGVSPRLIRDLRNRRHILADTEAAILAVPIPEDDSLLSDGTCVPIIGTVRRLRALVAIGYTNRQLAALIGTPHDHVQRILDMRYPTCTIAMARRAAELFDRLEETPPPDSYGSRRAKLRAEKRGWLPPIVWNPDTIDQPDAEPEVRKPRNPFWVPEYFADEYLEYRDFVRLDDELIAERFGITYDALVKRLLREGIEPQNWTGSLPERQAMMTDRCAS